MDQRNSRVTSVGAFAIRADSGLGRRLDLQRQRMLENLGLQGTELGTWFEAELLDQQEPRSLVDIQRLGLPTAPVQRQHQLTTQSLPQRVAPH